MNQNQRWPIFAMDVIGGCITAACLLCMAWILIISTHQTSMEMDQLTKAQRVVHRQLSLLKNECDRKRSLIIQIQSNMDQTGKLPEHAPIEDYFQTLAVLANHHHLRVLRHNPLTGRSYPGLIEQRFLYEVSGSMPDLVRYFKAIEDTQYWADISYLKIDRGSRMYRSRSKDRVAQLTISMFTSPEINKAQKTGL